MNSVSSPLPALLKVAFREVSSRKVFLVSEEKISYGQLYERVAKTRGLLQTLGLHEGDRLAVASTDKFCVAALYISCLLEGITAVILDPGSSASEITVLLDRSGPRAAFLDKDIIDNAELLRREATDTEIIAIENSVPTRTAFSLIIGKKKSAHGKNTYPVLLADQALVAEDKSVSATTIGLVLFTSGTTSKPKGVMLSHANLAAQLQTLIRQFGLSDQSKLLNHLPLHHSDGLNQGVLLSLAVGATWLAPPTVTMQNLGDVLDTIYRDRVTVFITVPTVLAMMAMLPNSYDDSFLSAEFEFIESTAGQLEEDLWRNIEKRFKTKIVNCYGLTETVCEAFYSGPDEQTREVGTIGKSVDCEARLINKNGEPAGVGEVGELLLKGDNIMVGYFDDEEATKDTFQDDWLKTGDLASCDESGFYRIVGRVKSVIIRAGLNIHPENITTTLLAHKAINAAATVGIADSLLGEKVVSCIVFGQAESPSIEDIYGYCRVHLAQEKIPNEIVPLEALPYGPSGKVDLGRLKEIVKEVWSSTDVSTSLVEQSLEARIISIASGAFHSPAESLSADSDQSNTKGWDSLAFLELIILVEKAFGFRFSPRDIMSIQTLGDFTEKTRQQVKLNNKGA